MPQIPIACIFSLLLFVTAHTSVSETERLALTTCLCPTEAGVTPWDCGVSSICKDKCKVCSHLIFPVTFVIANRLDPRARRIRRAVKPVIKDVISTRRKIPARLEIQNPEFRETRKHKAQSKN